MEESKDWEIVQEIGETDGNFRQCSEKPEAGLLLICSWISFEVSCSLLVSITLGTGY